MNEENNSESNKSKINKTNKPNKPNKTKSNKKNESNEKNEKNNKLSIKLNELCEDELDRYSSYFDDPANSNDKELFIKFIFSDIFKTDGKYSYSIKEIAEDPSEILQVYFEKITNRNNFNNILNTIKLKFIDKKKIIKEKIKECNDHLKIVKNNYLNLELKNIFESRENSSNKKLVFLNKKVLIYPETNKQNYEISEIFARYLFTASNSTRKNNPSESNANNFYNDTKITSFYDSISSSLRPFSSIDNNFKYLFILLFIISRFLTPNSDYSLLFDKKEFEKLIEKLVKLKSFKKKDGDGKKKKKKGKQSGGAKDKKRKALASTFASISKPSSQKGKKGDQKKGNQKKGNQKKENKNKDDKEKKAYEEILNKCYVSGLNDNLRKIYIEDTITGNKRYKTIIKDYYDSITPFNMAPGTNNSSAKTAVVKPIKNLFAPSDDKAKIKVDLNDISVKQADIKTADIKRHLEKVIESLDIFQSFRLLIEKNNQAEIENFMNEIKMKLVLFLYILYNLKKKIYEVFIENLNQTFFEQNNNNTNNSTNNNNNRDSSTGNNTNSRNNKSFSKKDDTNNRDQTNYNSLPANIKSNVINIDKEIKLLKIKMKNLDENNIYYEKKILEIQDKINELYVQKYQYISETK